MLKLLSSVAECGRTFQDNSGTFGSSTHPNSSPSVEGERCEWRITATHGERIVLNITSLDIYKSDYCKADYLEIRDGYWHKSPVLGKIHFIIHSYYARYNINAPIVH